MTNIFAITCRACLNCCHRSSTFVSNCTRSACFSSRFWRKHTIHADKCSIDQLDLKTWYYQLNTEFTWLTDIQFKSQINIKQTQYLIIWNKNRHEEMFTTPSSNGNYHMHTSSSIITSSAYVYLAETWLTTLPIKPRWDPFRILGSITVINHTQFFSCMVLYVNVNNSHADVLSFPSKPMQTNQHPPTISYQ